jgi:high-affinity iron transporter
MLASFLLALREGLEAALIIGIVLGVLLKLKRPDLKPMVWYGAALALGLSSLVALLLNLLEAEFEGVGEQIFEGTAMLLAAGVLTWMIFWMQHSASNLRNEIETQTNQALSEKSSQGLFILAFLAVFREGIELALFLLAVQTTSSPSQTLVGALAGLAGATILGWMIFTSTRKLSLRGFFRATNILLIIFAAGLVASGVHEFIEAGLIPAIVEHVWNLEGILSNESEVGLLLKALLGYNSTSSLSEVAGYLVYLAGILTFMLTGNRKVTVTAVEVAD